MSYYFTCAVVQSEPVELPSRFASYQIEPEILIIWCPDASRVPSPSDARDFIRIIAPISNSFLYIVYDDGVGVREATIFANGAATEHFGETDGLWLPLDDYGLPDHTANPITTLNMDGDEEYECIRCGISLALDTFCGAGRVSVSDVRQTISHGNA